MATARREPAPRALSPFRDTLIDLCYERGFAALTVTELCERAALDRAAFESLYVDLEDCFFQICSAELTRFHRLAGLARAGLGEWRDRLRATTYALYRYLDSDEPLRRFVIVEARAAGDRPALLIDSEIEALFDLIDEGRSESSAPANLTRATAESVGGGIFNEIYVAAAHRGPLPPESDFVPELMYSAVLPYMGTAAAAAELAIPPPSPSPGPGEPNSWPSRIVCPHCKGRRRHPAGGIGSRRRVDLRSTAGLRASGDSQTEDRDRNGHRQGKPHGHRPILGRPAPCRRGDAEAWDRPRRRPERFVGAAFRGGDLT